MLLESLNIPLSVKLDQSNLPHNLHWSPSVSLKEEVIELAFVIQSGKEDGWLVFPLTLLWTLCSMQHSLGQAYNIALPLECIPVWFMVKNIWFEHLSSSLKKIKVHFLVKITEGPHIQKWQLYFCIRPKKKKKVCLPFFDRPKILEKRTRQLFFFFFDTQFCIFWQKCSNKIRILNVILRFCMPKNAHTWMVLHFFHIQK